MSMDSFDVVGICFSELFLEFELDRFSNGINTLLHVYHSRTFHEQVLLASYIGRSDGRFAHAECVDAALQHGADGFDQILLLICNGCALILQLNQRRSATTLCLHIGNLLIQCFQLILYFILRNAEVELCAPC